MRTALSLLLLGSLATGHVVAQTPSVGLSADAVVVTGGIVIVSVASLSFGQVSRGIPTTVAATSANAAQFDATGSGDAYASITVALPTSLTNIQALPGSAIPIAFGGGSALWRQATNDPFGATAFDPASGTVGRFGPGTNPHLYIWIGGTVNPDVTAKPGIYQGDIVVTLTYL